MGDAPSKTNQPASELIDRLEAASGPDEMLGAKVVCTLLAPPGSFVTSYAAVFTSPNNLWRNERERGDPNPYDCTHSVDAALALAERVLPGWDYCLSKGSDEPASASLSPSHRVAEVTAEAPTPALALCIAILRAVQAQASERPARDGARTQNQDNPDV